MKAAVVGLGIGMAHVAGYLQSSQAELYAVCDLIPERLAKVRGTFDQGSMLCLEPLFDEKMLTRQWGDIGVKTFTSLDELLKDDAVDIISICTPDYLHAEHAEKAVRAGKHLLLGKPVDIRIEEAEKLHSLLEIELRLMIVLRLKKELLPLRKLVDVLYDFSELFVRQLVLAEHPMRC